MKKLMWLCLSVLLISPSFSAQNEATDLKEYVSSKYQISFSYPKNWLLEDETTDNYLLSLYSPEALSSRKETPELVTGIKTEFYFFSAQQDNEHQEFYDCPDEQKSFLKNKFAKQIEQCTYEEDIFVIASLVKERNNRVIIVAYIPEKKKKDVYLTDYNKIVSSFSYLKNGSP